MSPSAVLDDLYLRHNTRLTDHIDTLLAAHGEEEQTEDAVQDTWVRILDGAVARDWPELRDLADEIVTQTLQAKTAENLLVVALRPGPDREPVTSSQPTLHRLTRPTPEPGRRPLSPSLPQAA
ncbi:bacteriocin immunity protein [Streptomyces sp. SID7982]|uniref:bacteriocin immunity protein n=1 Tax=Streptomyces sp. BRB081 TaxID=2769544 RepID=UPI0013BED125|nr:bacteriocin immunity protein [Streptomyces sp. BRB081]MBL3805026.1 bacteriocin immunity protein [Streptomyces sp. BRB081]NEE25444.1 bacteriocin immunity protein [Streptomyces sp. SID7982]